MGKQPQLERPLQDLDRQIKSTKQEALRSIQDMIASASEVQRQVSKAPSADAAEAAVKAWQESNSKKLREIFATEASVEFFNTPFITYGQVSQLLQSIDYRVDKLLQLKAVIAMSPPLSYQDVWFDFWRDPRMPFQIGLWLLTVLLGSGIVIFWLEEWSSPRIEIQVSASQHEPGFAVDKTELSIKTQPGRNAFDFIVVLRNTGDAALERPVLVFAGRPDRVTFEPSQVDSPAIQDFLPFSQVKKDYRLDVRAVFPQEVKRFQMLIDVFGGNMDAQTTTFNVTVAQPAAAPASQ